MPGKVAGLSKIKDLLPVVLRHLSPVVHGEYVLTWRTKGNRHRNVCSSRELPEVLYTLELVMRQEKTN